MLFVIENHNNLKLHSYGNLTCNFLQWKYEEISEMVVYYIKFDDYKYLYNKQKLYLAEIVFPVTVFPRNNKCVRNCKIIISTQNIIPPSVACKKMD